MPLLPPASNYCLLSISHITLAHGVFQPLTAFILSRFWRIALLLALHYAGLGHLFMAMGGRHKLEIPIAFMNSVPQIAFLHRSGSFALAHLILTLTLRRSRTASCHAVTSLGPTLHHPHPPRYLGHPLALQSPSF
ncbi:hypothetical protein BT63DRAFT_296333 [Microthyrium microscopicum]|uniref:Uncharacterized protein n=1 Tax=Microthyrium microscopicum TaxID=703497 RepID=A0A6A6U626_9PEZI|nr:hypothetical protein BT63DRAFT_296333 [Microthyrium microscopicum]